VVEGSPHFAGSARPGNLLAPRASQCRFGPMQCPCLGSAVQVEDTPYQAYSSGPPMDEKVKQFDKEAMNSYYQVEV
jgi:hypothetical protein